MTNAHDQVKEPDPKRLCAVLFQLHDILAKLCMQ